MQLRRSTAATMLAALGTSWTCLARGGELCSSAKQMGPSREDLQLKQLKNGTRYGIVYLRPPKKRGAAMAPKVPQYIEEADGGGADVCILIRRMVAADPVAVSEQAATPLFRLQR